MISIFYPSFRKPMPLFPQHTHKDQYANGLPSSTSPLSILHSKNSPHCLLASAQLPPSATAHLHLQFCFSFSRKYTNYFSILSILSAIPPRLIASSWIRMAQCCPSNKLPPTLTLPSPLHCTTSCWPLLAECNSSTDDCLDRPNSPSHTFATLPLPMTAGNK